MVSFATTISGRGPYLNVSVSAWRKDSKSTSSWFTRGGAARPASTLEKSGATQSPYTALKVICCSASGLRMGDPCMTYWLMSTAYSLQFSRYQPTSRRHRCHPQIWYEAHWLSRFSSVVTDMRNSNSSISLLVRTARACFIVRAGRTAPAGCPPWPVSGNGFAQPARLGFLFSEASFMSPVRESASRQERHMPRVWSSITPVLI